MFVIDEDNRKLRDKYGITDRQWALLCSREAQEWVARPQPGDDDLDQDPIPLTSENVLEAFEQVERELAQKH